MNYITDQQTVQIKTFWSEKKWMFSYFVITRNGEDWYTLRKSVQKLMMHPRAAAKYLDAQSDVADDFVDIIRVKCRADGEVEGLYNLMLQYTMECKSFPYYSNVKCV